MLATTCRGSELLPFAEVDSDRAPGGREDEHRGGVGDLQVDRALGGAGLGRCGVHEQRAPGRAVRVGRGIEFLRDRGAQQHGAPQQFAEGSDLGQQRVSFGLELDAGELRQTAQTQLEDVLRLQLAQIEDRAQARAGLLRVVG